MKLGGGGRFAKVAAAAGGGKKGAAIAAAMGRKKYGAKKMSKMAVAGKKRAKK
jgi:predicted Na+-dependent transporter